MAGKTLTFVVTRAGLTVWMISADRSSVFCILSAVDYSLPPCAHSFFMSVEFASLRVSAILAAIFLLLDLDMLRCS